MCSSPPLVGHGAEPQQTRTTVADPPPVLIACRSGVQLLQAKPTLLPPRLWPEAFSTSKSKGTIPAPGPAACQFHLQASPSWLTATRLAGSYKLGQAWLQQATISTGCPLLEYPDPLRCRLRTVVGGPSVGDGVS